MSLSQCASISPADSNYVETISTLRYAGRAKSIQNRAHVNEEPKDALLRHFQEEIAELKKQLEEGAFDVASMVMKTMKKKMVKMMTKMR